MKNKAVKHDQLCPFGGHTVQIFLGKSIWSYCRLSLNVSRISKTQPTPLSVFSLSDARVCTRRICTLLTKHATYQIVLPIVYLHCFKGRYGH